MSLPVRLWIDSLRIRSYEVSSDRAQSGSKRLGEKHRRVLQHLADRARHNGLAFPGMADIARAAELGGPDNPDIRRARSYVADLKEAELIKVEEHRGRKRASTYNSNDFWVRLPWVEEPDHVSDLPLLEDDEFPIGAKLRQLKQGGHTIDVEYYIRQATLRDVNRVPETPFSEGKSGAGDASSALNRAPATVNRAPVAQPAGLNRVPGALQTGQLREPGSEAAKGESGNARARVTPSAAPRAEQIDRADKVGNGAVNVKGHKVALPGMGALAAWTSGPGQPPTAWECPSCGPIGRRALPPVVHLVDAAGRGHWVSCEFVRTGRRRPSQWPTPPPGVEPEAPAVLDDTAAPNAMPQPQKAAV